jgi:hypothetical protein
VWPNNTVVQQFLHVCVRSKHFEHGRVVVLILSLKLNLFGIFEINFVLRTGGQAKFNVFAPIMKIFHRIKAHNTTTKYARQQTNMGSRVLLFSMPSESQTDAWPRENMAGCGRGSTEPKRRFQDFGTGSRNRGS